MRSIRTTFYLSNYDGRAELITRQIAREIEDRADRFWPHPPAFKVKRHNAAEAALYFTANESEQAFSFERISIMVAVCTAKALQYIEEALTTEPNLRLSAIKSSVRDGATGTVHEYDLPYGD